MEAELAVLALLVAGYALVAGGLERFSVGPAFVFVVFGIVLSDDVLGRISIEPEAEPIKVLAEATLTLLLFADASTIRVRALQRDARPVALLLVVGLLLTVALGTAGALLLFPGVSLGIALLIGASLAPTDAALGHGWCPSGSPWRVSGSSRGRSCSWAGSDRAGWHRSCSS